MSAETIPIPAPIDTDALRAAEFPWAAETAYFNHASVGPLPERTLRALDAFNRRRSMPFTLPDRDLFATMATSRRLVSQLLAVAPEEIALTVNTGFGLSVIARALPVERGDLVLVSDREFPANVYPWMRLREIGVETRAAADDRQRGGPTRRGSWRGWRTRGSGCWRCRWCSSATATRSTSPRSRRPPRDRHLPGGGRDPGAGASRSTCGHAGGHAVLRGPEVAALALGIGFIYVRRELIPRLNPPVTGWMAFEGTDDFTGSPSYARTLRADARRFEMITPAVPGLRGDEHVAGPAAGVGVDRIAATSAALHAPGARLGARHGVRVASPVGATARGSSAWRRPSRRRAYRALREAADHRQPARGGHPAEPPPLQYGRGDGRAWWRCS